MPAQLEPITLTGKGVRLEMLSHDHVPGLLEACRPPRESFRYTWVPEPTISDVARYVDTALAAHAAGVALPFATVHISTGTVVGSTRFMNAEYWASRDGHPSTVDIPDAVEIGATWLASSSQRTHVNTEAKVLMLTHAFETWRVKRVIFKTDARNTTSRANIERVGATLEGILRHHMHSADGENNGLRDTATYSILAREWPDAKVRLTERLDR